MFDARCLATKSPATMVGGTPPSSSVEALVLLAPVVAVPIVVRYGFAASWTTALVVGGLALPLTLFAGFMAAMYESQTGG